MTFYSKHHSLPIPKGSNRTRRKALLAVCMLLCIQPAATAQETVDSVEADGKMPGVIKQVLDRLNRPPRYLDDRYVRKPPTKFIVTLRGRVQQTGVRINDYSELDTDWGLANSTQADLRMQERLHYKAGCYITYSGIRAGLGMSVGRKSAEKSTSLYLGCINSYYGLTAQYNNIKEKVSSDVHSTVDYHGENYENDFMEDDTYMESDYPADMREIQLDGYYAFNRRRFAYTAVYGGSVVQRRSAGSWMLGMKYLYGRVKFDSRESIFPTHVGGITRFTTQQLSVGGGYSYNLVLLNRDESGPLLRGLRNLTFNATFMPMVTMFNPLTIYYDKNLVEWFGYETDHRTRKSHPELNYTATTGMALSIDRFSFVVKVHYDNFRFNTGLQDENMNKLGDEYAMQKNRMKGRFFNWGVRADFQMKF